jgi:ABC-type multidrug transport system ATPase subunit
MIRFFGVRFGYRDDVAVIEGADLEIDPGLTLLLGPNGSGKSTLLRLAAGIEKPDAGRITVGGMDLWAEEVAARRELAYVPEQPDLTPYATIEEILRLVCRLRGEPASASREYLDAVGLGGLLGRSVRELSMGQRRRVTLAAAMVGHPRVLLLDEPLEAMDRAFRETILGWIEQARLAGAAVIVAGHETAPLAAAAARALTVRRGKPLLFDPLPESPEKRSAVLDDLARGGEGTMPASTRGGTR